MAEPEIRQFIAHLAVARRISASTQTVALSALLFLYRDVLKQELPYVSGIERAKRAQKLPVVFNRAEVQSVLAPLKRHASPDLQLALWSRTAFDGSRAIARQRHRL